ncbi:MAG: CHAT domain-containing protein [Richelia sp. RM2_1_2]|nr:CHAT domain-containing protein [Richelia sp. RM2_1_2]
MFKIIRFYLLISLKLSLWLALIPLAALLDAKSVKAQASPGDKLTLPEPVQSDIEAAPNDTNTQVPENLVINQGERRIDITGGQPSGNNLFHSFTKFNVTAGETANFVLPELNINNVINRVIGGNESVINGDIRVDGNSVNFYLMNPAGIIFGSNANLDVNGTFTATTANGISFGSDWFNASGTNNYTALNSNPTAFGFTMSQPGGIDIRGNLSVGGGNLNLIGGTVVSSGEISGGQVNITTVPGNTLVTLTEPGSPLSLQIQPISASSTQPNNWNLPILSLPQLLTAGDGGNANKFTDNGDGTIQLSGSGITVENGDVALENITDSGDGGSIDSAIRANNINILANRNLIVEGNINEASGSESSVNLSAQGDITTKDINLSGYGGPVELFAEGNIITGDIDTNGYNINIAGNVSLNAEGNIITGNIDTSGFDSSGDVSLNAGENIAFNSINTQALFNSESESDSAGGNVNITAGGIIKGTGTIPGDGNNTDTTTILTSGNTPGSINISHNGGADNVPFKVGDASENGTVGAIDNGISSIAAGYGGSVDFPVLPNGGDATNTPDGIIITSVNSPPNLTANQQINLSKTEPTQLTFEELNALVDDADGDNTSIQIDRVTSGSLKINGVEVSSPATINPGDNLEYTPPANTIGDINGFVISASDKVSSSIPQTVGGRIENTPPTLESNSEIITTENQPSEFTFEDLKTVVNDADGDDTFIQIDEITRGILRRNGEIITPGTRLSAGDKLEYTPPENTNGNIPAFTIRASDGFASSTPQSIGVTAVPQEDNPQKPPQAEPPFESPKFPTNPLPPINIDPVVFNIDNKFATAYESYFNFSKRERVSLVKAQEILLKIEKAAGVKPAIIYVSFTSIQLNASSSQNRLDLVLVTANGEPIRKTINTANQEEMYSVVDKFYDTVLEPNNNSYLAPAQKLYQWMVAPLEEELKAKGINNLLFITDERLRSIPLAALHDGKQFLVEKYSVGFTPSLSLTNTEYKDVRKSQVLAMGASEFQDDNPLPAVPQEVSTIAQDIWQGTYLLNKDFTLENLKSLKNQFGIIHLATHGQFNGGPPEDSFIRLWNNKLNLNEFGDLKFSEPTVELLVLSACETAMGNDQAELGFGGLAVRTGAKTALASLWQVDDSATLGLMTEFYQQLRKAPIKSEALRQAQIAMLKGEIRVENGQLRTSTRGVSLPPQVVQSLSKRKINTLTHPYYWSAFTMIGNPW